MKNLISAIFLLFSAVLPAQGVVQSTYTTSVLSKIETIVDISMLVDTIPNPYHNSGRLSLKHGELNSGTIEMPIGTWFYIEQYPGVEWKLEQRLKQKK